MTAISPLVRTFLSAGLVSAWLVCLLIGWTFAGAIHLALVGSLAAFPWRQLRN